MNTSICQWYWHADHDVLVARLTVPIEDQIEYIMHHEPAAEIETRLRLLRPVQNVAVLDGYETAVRRTWEAYKALECWAGDTHKAAEYRAWKAHEAVMRRVWKTYDALVRQRWEAQKELHRKECPNCPWNGKTIFPKESTVGEPQSPGSGGFWERCRRFLRS